MSDYSTELEALAETLNTARETANGIEAVAAQSNAYGFIAEALKATLTAMVGTEAAEAAYQSLLDGSSVASAIAYATGERTAYLSCFDDYALEAMVSGGKWNDFTAKLETATREEVDAVYASRKESSEHWEAEQLADEAAGKQNPVVSDTVSVPLYSLLVAGKKSEHGTCVTKWGIAYAVVRELQSVGIDPEFNTGIISAVLDTLENNTSVIAGGLEDGFELSTVFEANN